MDYKDKAEDVGKEILKTGQGNLGRWMMAALFVAGFLIGFMTKWFWF